MEEAKMGSSAEETALDSVEPQPTTQTATGSSATQEQVDSPRNRPNPSAKAFDGSQNIVDATKACRDSFARCPVIKGLGINWAEDRLADFKLWDASVQSVHLKDPAPYILHSLRGSGRGIHGLLSQVEDLLN
ncbi:unnamed protein product [Alternaria alternata]